MTSTATIAQANRALELVEPSDHLRRGSAAALVGLALWTVGDLASASRRYTESIASLTAAGHISDVLGCSIALADMHLALGRLGDAIRTYQTGLDLAAAHGVVRGTADMHIGLCEAALERNDLTAATQHLEASTQLGEQAGLPQHAYRWRVATARIRRARGDLEGALDLLDAAERVYNTDMSPPVRPVAAVKVQVQLAHGDTAAAMRWASECGLNPDDDLSYVHEFEHITVARVAPRHAHRRSRQRLAPGRDTAVGAPPRRSRRRTAGRKRHRDPRRAVAAHTRPPAITRRPSPR